MIEGSIISVFTAIILGFIAGASLTWPSPEIPYLNNTVTGPFNGTITDDEASWIGSLVALGAIPGPFVFGYLVDKIGRKYTLLAIAAPCAVSYIFIAFSNIIIEFYLTRFILGLCVGGSFSILPMYVAEMSSDEHRGILGSTINVFVSFGLVFTYVAGSYIENVTSFNLFLGGLILTFFTIFWFFGLETPHWYILQNKPNLAKQTLYKMRNTSDEATEKELEQIRSFVEGEKKGNIFDIFKSRGNTKALLIGSGLVFFQQISGICAILFFAQSIFEKSGTSLDASYCSIIIGFVQFITSFITPLVSNHFGRKSLLIFSGIGVFLSEGGLGIYGIIEQNNPEILSSLKFLPVVLLVLYIFTFNVGFGPLPWAIMGEIFPTNTKSVGSALVTSICWTTCFFVTKGFGQIVATVGQGPCFIGFAVTSLVAVGFTHFFVIETKGKSLIQIQQDLNK